MKNSKQEAIEIIEDLIDRHEHRSFAKGFRIGLETIIELGYQKKHFKIIKALVNSDLNITKVAKELNMPRQTLQYQIEKYKKIFKIVTEKNK